MARPGKLEYSLACLSCVCHCPADPHEVYENDPPVAYSEAASASCPGPKKAHEFHEEDLPFIPPHPHACRRAPSGAAGPQGGNCRPEAVTSRPLVAESQSPAAGRDEPQTVAALLAEGRLLEAQRTVQELEPPSSLDPDSAERLKRIGVSYEASLGDLLADADRGWTSEKVQDLQYSYRLADGKFQLVSTIQSDADPVKALAAILEVDLCKGYKTNVISGTPLTENPDAFDSVWQVVQKGKFSGLLEDNISYLSVVDALDEDLGSIWACVYPPEPGDRYEFAAMIPGATREGNWRTTFRITPLRDFRGSGRPGFQMSAALNVTPSKAGLAVISAMPSWLLRVGMSRAAKELLDTFAKHMDNCEELQRRITSSPRAAAYLYLRKRLAGEALNTKLSPKPSSSTVSTMMTSSSSNLLLGTSVTGGSSSASTSSGTDGDQDRAEEPSSPAVDIMTWEQVSQEVPLNWASYQD